MRFCISKDLVTRTFQRRILLVLTRRLSSFGSMYRRSSRHIQQDIARVILTADWIIVQRAKLRKVSALCCRPLGVYAMAPSRKNCLLHTKIILVPLTSRMPVTLVEEAGVLARGNSLQSEKGLYQHTEGRPHRKATAVTMPAESVQLGGETDTGSH